VYVMDQKGYGFVTFQDFSAAFAFLEVRCAWVLFSGCHGVDVQQYTSCMQRSAHDQSVEVRTSDNRNSIIVHSAGFPVVQSYNLLKTQQAACASLCSHITYQACTLSCQQCGMTLFSLIDQ
jgi:hypothetical protein